jgi:hypothetical protein
MKEYFATIGLTLIPFAVSTACCYLIGSFISLSFDPTLWTMEMRMLMSVVGVVFGGALYAKVENTL